MILKIVAISAYFKELSLNRYLLGILAKVFVKIYNKNKLNLTMTIDEAKSAITNIYPTYFLVTSIDIFYS